MKFIHIIFLLGSIITSISCQAYAALNHKPPVFVQINYDDTTYSSNKVQTTKNKDLISLDKKIAPYGYEQNIIYSNNVASSNPKIQEYQIELSSTPNVNITTEEALSQVNYNDGTIINNHNSSTNLDSSSDSSDSNSGQSNNSTTVDSTDPNAYSDYDFKQNELHTQIQCFEEICKYTLLPHFIQKASLHIEKMDYSKIIFKVNSPFYFEIENKNNKLKISKTLLTLDDLNDNNITLVAGKIRTTLNIDFTNYTKEDYQARVDQMNQNLENVLFFILGLLFVGGGVYWYLES